MLKNYKFSFQLSALALFLFIMVPNFIWFAIPVENDILRKEAVLPALDIIQSIFQALLIATLIFIKNKTAKPPSGLSYISVISMVILYYLCWVLYYFNIVNYLSILGLAVFPCLAFLLYAVIHKNYVAVIPTIIFAVCHIAGSVINFII